MKDTYTPINSLERVCEKLSSLISDLQIEKKSFRALEKEKDSFELLA